mgnify:CR=1 FL=1
MASNQSYLLDLEPEIFVASLIVERAVEDWNTRRRVTQESRGYRSGYEAGRLRMHLLELGFPTAIDELLCFFYGEELEELCTLLGSDGAWARRMLGLP